MNEKEKKALAVGHIPSGLFIVCAKDDKKIDGYLASWIQQVSFDPLLISLSVKPGRPVYDLINAGAVFTVNVVGDHERDYLKLFWSGYSPDKNPFTQIPHSQTKLGGVAIEAAKSCIDCKMKLKIAPGDHQLVIAEVLASQVMNEKARSVAHIRKTGLDY